MSDPLDSRLRRKLTQHRGRLHAYPEIDPARTAVVGIDLVRSFVEGLAGARDLIASVNRLTRGARAAGAAVAWVLPQPPGAWRNPRAAEALLGAAAVARYEMEALPDGPGASLADGLLTEPDDWNAVKTGYSAFFPGNSDLPERLSERGIDTVILCGVLTDVCVAASARDAFEAGYKVILCSDGVAAGDPVQNRAELRTLARTCADVRPVVELVALLHGGLASAYLGGE